MGGIMIAEGLVGVIDPHKFTGVVSRNKQLPWKVRKMVKDLESNEVLLRGLFVLEIMAGLTLIAISERDKCDCRKKKKCCKE